MTEVRPSYPTANFDDLLQEWLDSFEGFYMRGKDGKWNCIDIGGWDNITSFNEFVRASLSSTSTRNENVE